MTFIWRPFSKLLFAKPDQMADRGTALQLLGDPSGDDGGETAGGSPATTIMIASGERNLRVAPSGVTHFDVLPLARGALGPSGRRTTFS